MGCAPSSAVDESTKANDKVNGEREDDEGGCDGALVKVPTSEDREEEVPVKSGAVLLVGGNNGAGGVCCAKTNKSKSKNHRNGNEGASDKVGVSDCNRCPARLCNDEDSESESSTSSFLCANLRRNFMTSSRSGNDNGGSRRKQRNGSSGGNLGLQPSLMLAATTEEQGESFLSSTEEGDNNPLLKRSTLNVNPSDTTSLKSASDGCSSALLLGNQSSAPTTTMTTTTAAHQNVPHYVQLQQYHQNFPFNFGRKLSNHAVGAGEKEVVAKMDSIVSVTSGFGTSSSGHSSTLIATSTGIRAKSPGNVCPSFGRLGHRKSSLALTPEEEPFDVVPKPSIDSKYPFLLPPNPLLRVLLVFHKTDSVYEGLLNACQRVNGEATLCRSLQAAEDAFRNTATGYHHLVIVDSRSPKHIDPEVVCSTLRSTKVGQYTTFVAVVKKSAYEKDDSTIFSYIDWGFSRCIVESSNACFCYGEVLQIYHCLVRSQNIMATQQATFTALNRTKQALMITDDHLRIQFTNKAMERLLNARPDEVLSRATGEFFLSDLSAMQSQIARGREFDGVLSIRKKCTDAIAVHVHAIPVYCIGNIPTHIVLTVDMPNANSNETMPLVPTKEAGPRGSLHSIRRGSFDVRSVGSDCYRRTSLAKLNALPLEAPITQVVTILSQIQENCSFEEARLLDRVMEVLKREGLYNAQLKEIRMEDPIASDLIGALLTEKGAPANISSRRSSNDSIIRSGRGSGTIPAAKPKSSSQISTLLDTALEWNFDIFRLEEISEKRPLMYLGMELCQKFDVFETFNIDEATMRQWLIVIEANYHVGNSYHNSTHAADVMQAAAVFLQQIARKEPNLLDQMDVATSLLAAAAHDIDHPGKSSAFLCNSDDKLALLYNDMTVLESHHAAMTFQLTLRDDKVNIFKNLDRETFKLARSMIIDMILATEMTRHFEHLAKFVSVFGNDTPDGGKDQGPSATTASPEKDDNQNLVRRMLIKCADVSNPARPFIFCVEWAHRIANEYFTQTDEEKKRGMPIVMPMFDRVTCSISKSQIGFIEYIIEDMLNAWDGFIDMPEIINNMQSNYQQWKVFEQQGIITLSDIKAKQVSMNSAHRLSMS